MNDLRECKIGDKATINLSCPRCTHKANCEQYQSYLGSLGKQQDIVSLLIRRSVLHGQKMEIGDMMWRLDKLIRRQVEEKGQVEHQGMKFFFNPKIKRTYDPWIVKDILTKNGLWSDGMMKIDVSLVEKLMERNPGLIAEMQRAIISTETSYQLEAKNDFGVQKRMINF
jgi:hypothetical protein